MQREESRSVLAQGSWDSKPVLSKRNPGMLVGDNELLYGWRAGEALLKETTSWKGEGLELYGSLRRW